jgi:hypothetical protein
MAETARTYRVVNRDILPDEVAEHDIFGKNEQGRLVGYEDGNQKVVQHLSDLLMKTWIKVGAVEEVEPELQSPEVVALNGRILELEAQLQVEREDHAAEIQRLQTDFTKELELRDRQIAGLTASVSSLTAQLEAKGIIDKPAEPVAYGTIEDGFVIPRPVIDPEPEPPIQPVEETVISERRPIAEPVVVEPEPEPYVAAGPPRVARVEPLPPRAVAAADRRTIYPPVAAEEELVVEEEPVWYRRPAVVAVLGGLAAATAVLAGIGIWNHHELEELEHHQPTPIENVAPDHDNNQGAGNTFADNGYATPTILAANGYHLDYYNQNKGKKITGVWVPKNVDLAGSPGNYRLVKNGKTLVRNAQWDSQGKLSRANMSELRKKDGYNVGWSFIKGDRKVSVVLNR